MTCHVLNALCYKPESTYSLPLSQHMETNTHTEMLTHLHLHKGSPVEAACCSRQGTPQTTPLRHGGYTPFLCYLSSNPSLCFFLLFLYFPSPSSSLPRLLCPLLPLCSTWCVQSETQPLDLACPTLATLFACLPPSLPC